MAIKFIVKKEDGVVVALLNDTTMDAIRLIDKTNKTGSAFSLIDDVKNYCIEDGYKGVARCNFADGDVFDEKVGRQLATKRLMKRYNKDIKRVMNKYLIAKAKDIARLTKTIDRLDKSINS